MKNKYQNVAVIILAGGKSKRAETTKGLRKIGNKYWIDLQIEFFRDIGIKKIFIGLGYDHQEYLKKSKQLNHTNYFINTRPDNGSFSTLQTVIKQVVNKNFSQLIIMFIDHAIPKITTINQLINNGNFEVQKPTFKKQSGHPITINHAFAKHLSKQPHTSQLDIEIKQLNISQINWIEVNDKLILENFNTKDKWLNYKNSV